MASKTMAGSHTHSQGLSSTPPRQWHKHQWIRVTQRAGAPGAPSVAPTAAIAATDTNSVSGAAGFAALPQPTAATAATRSRPEESDCRRCTHDPEWPSLVGCVGWLRRPREIDQLTEGGYLFRDVRSRTSALLRLTGASDEVYRETEHRNRSRFERARAGGAGEPNAQRPLVHRGLIVVERGAVGIAGE